MPAYRPMPPYARQPIPSPVPTWSPPAPVGRVLFPQPTPPGARFLPDMLDVYGAAGHTHGVDYRRVIHPSYAPTYGQQAISMYAGTKDQKLFGSASFGASRPVSRDDLIVYEGDEEIALFGAQADLEDAVESARVAMERLGEALATAEALSGVFGEDAPEGAAPKRPFPKVRDFFTQRLPALAKKMKTDEGRASLVADTARQQAERAEERAQTAEIRAQAAEEYAKKMEQATAKQAGQGGLTTMQMVGVASVVAGLGVLAYAVTRDR